MNNITLRKFLKLEYREPRSFLIELRKFELEVSQSKTAYKLRALRTNKLKEVREMREAAIFCHLMGERIGETIYLSPGEDQDHDFVAMYQSKEGNTFTKVQLKELAPTDIAASSTIEEIIASLEKYKDAENLCVAIHLNRELTFAPSSLKIPKLKIGSLWVFGAIKTDQSEWGLWGDFLSTSNYGTKHNYPDGTT
ncbi:MAG: hypothetical protein Q7T62_02260 [Undibacterium sp.]|nr:hypothetical protein [Undibacterium sp.]